MRDTKRTFRDMYMALIFAAVGTILDTAQAQVGTPTPFATASATPTPEMCIRCSETDTLDAIITLTDNEPTLLAKANKPSTPSAPLQATLVRQCNTNGCWTGTLSIGDFECKTLELPSRGNAKNISCIPPGTYTCNKRKSQKRGLVFWIDDVPGRSDVQIHSGNTTDHTIGCVLLGTRVNYDHNYLYNSKAAVTNFMNRLSGTSKFVLTIVEPSTKKPPPPAQATATAVAMR